MNYLSCHVIIYFDNVIILYNILFPTFPIIWIISSND